MLDGPPLATNIENAVNSQAAPLVGVVLRVAEYDGLHRIGESADGRPGMIQLGLRRHVQQDTWHGGPNDPGRRRQHS